MSDQHVVAVFGPAHVREELGFYRKRMRDADGVILSLRRMLIARDPSLPDPYDGKAWHEIEGRQA